MIDGWAHVTAIHVHPRDPNGRQTLDGDVIGEICTRIRAEHPIPIGITTELSIVGSVDRRLEVIQQWSVLPDYATVNVSEPGWEQLARWLLAHEVGVEAGVWSTSDALALIESGLSREFDRLLVEPISPPVDTALAIVDEIHVTLDRGAVEVPRLQHTEDDSGWLIVANALRRGIQTRVGLEDLLLLPDGSHPVNNAELVAAAHQLTA